MGDDFLMENKYWILILVVCSLLVNAFFLNTDQTLPSDGSVYSQIGKNIAEGKGYTYNGEPNFLWPPLTSMMLGGVYSLFGLNDIYGMYLIILFSALCVIPIFLIAKEFFSVKTAIIASSLFILNQAIIQNSTTILSDIPALFFFLMFFYLFSKESYAWSGVFLGLMALTRRTAVVVLICALVYMFLRKCKIKDYILFILPLLVLVLPFFYWTYTVTGNPFYSQQEGLTVPITNSVVYETKAITGTLPSFGDYSMITIFYLVKKWVVNFVGIFLWIIPTVLNPLLLLPLLLFFFVDRTYNEKCDKDEESKKDEYTRLFKTFFIGFVILFSFSMATQRYLLVVIPLLLIMVADGLLCLQERFKFKDYVLILILLIYLTPTLFGWMFYEPVNPEWKTAGEWMKANLPEGSKVLSRKPQMPYYAGMDWAQLPMNLNESIYFAKQNNYQYIVFDEAYTAIYRPDMSALLYNQTVDSLDLIYSDSTPMRKVNIWRVNG
jgi:4-amino-4-deoxy-L-arabinose transferase-like glycosyltransferase